MTSEKRNLDGQHFGKLIVLERKEYKSRKGNVRYMAKCLCQCGNIKEILVKNLLNGRTKSCGCDRSYYDKMSGDKNACFKGYKEIRKTYWNKLAKRSELCGRKFSLDIKFGWELFEAQNRKCALTGLPIYFDKCTGNTTASLDRIDSTLGYEKDNVQWVHKDVNKMKNVYSVEYFIKICKLVASMH